MTAERVPCIEFDSSTFVHVSERCPAVLRQPPESLRISWWSREEAMDCPSICSLCWMHVKFKWTGERYQACDLGVWDVENNTMKHRSPNEAMS